MNPFVTALGMMGLWGSNFYSLKKRPLVFVPGLYGSMGENIIKGTGAWSFGMSAPIYDPFIEILEDLGYKRDENLFIGFYDWRKPCMYGAKNYLKPLIQKVKRKCKTHKVDIIAHSMGGLVSRAYIQSIHYGYDVDQLIMMATPNRGSVNAYCFWAGGQLPYSDPLIKTLLGGYLWILKKKYNYSKKIEVIHGHLKGVQDLLPSKSYGDYLYFYKGRGKIEYIPYKDMQDQNLFLDKMNEYEDILNKRKVKVTLIAGIGEKTNEALRVNKRMCEEDEWKDGKVVSTLESRKGDGTVMLKSALGIQGDVYEVKAEHTSILQKSTSILEKKLGKRQGNTYGYSIKNKDTHKSILIKGTGNILVKGKGPKGKILYHTDPSSKYIYVQNIEHGMKWIMIVGEDIKDIYLEYTPKESENIEISIYDENGRRKMIRETCVNINQTYRIKV